MYITSEKKKNILERIDALLLDLEDQDRQPIKIVLTEGEAMSFIDLLPNNSIHRSELGFLGIRQLNMEYKGIPIVVV